MNKTLSWLLLVLVMASPAKAQTTCGELAGQYLDFLKERDDGTASSFSSGYYQGFVWGYVLGDAGRDYEMPHGVTAEQVSRVVGTFLSNNRQMWHLPMWDCVHRALLDAWPLRK